MALRDKPYLPLYTKDFSTDEKVRECSAASVGVYIFLMCLLHKQINYGKLLLKQNDKQNDKQILNFACKVAKHLPFNMQIIEASLIELLEKEVIQIDGDCLSQKRMVNDDLLSQTRAISGKIGGDKNKFAQAKPEAKTQANPDIGIDNGIETEKGGIGGMGGEGINEKEIDDVCISLQKFFGYESEMKYLDKQKLIFSFACKLKVEGKLEHFKEQFNFYLKYKKLNGQQTHGFKSFLDGGWDSDNWKKKFLDINKTQQGWG